VSLVGAETNLTYDVYHLVRAVGRASQREEAEGHIQEADCATDPATMPGSKSGRSMQT